MVKVSPFGAMNGQDVPLITLSGGGIALRLLPLGATLQALSVPDRTGQAVDIALGYDAAADYLSQDGCMGGTVGRCANRIAGAEFSLDGAVFRLSANEGANQLHGGVTGFHKKLWRFSTTQDSVTFTLDSPHGEEGYPGALHAEATYALRDGTVVLSYRAVSDRSTVVNLTNHTYFNLAGHDGGPVSDHVLTLQAQRYTPCGPGNIPTGVLAETAGTALDFRRGAVLGGRLDDPFLAKSQGYDHNFALDAGADPAASLWCPSTGIRLDVSTSLPGMQLYTAGFLSPRRGKGGAGYGPRQAVCLETQQFPDAIHHPNFPSPVLRAGAEYRAETVWQFSVK